MSSTKKHAVLVHLNPMAGISPLAGGYLKTFAEQEAGIRSAWDIELYSQPFDVSASSIVRDLVAKSPDLVGFSLFVWNIGLIQRLLPALRGLLSPETQFLLGGVQIMNSAHDYVDRAWENVIVCNGEGERTFRDLLVQNETSRPDLSAVRGITFLSGGEFITTEPQERIKALEEIPSPYLNDVFEEKDLAIALFETNRGCPYKCEYCFWGGAIGQKINRLPMDRLMAEIEYLASKRTRSILVCDANLGIFPEDTEIARKFVASHKETGYPMRVTYSSAKNKPERAVEIADILAKGGVLSTQPISLQTMDQNTLDTAKRHNIKPETYLALQRRMNVLKVPSFIELIWPLPGETLESFKNGIQKLCTMGAQAFGVYPLVWLKNVGFESRKDELGIVTMEEADPIGGGHVVIQTNEVTYEDWVSGMVFANSVMVLFDSRGFFCATNILNSLGIESFRGVFDRFVNWMNDAPKGKLRDLWHNGRNNFEEMYQYNWRGAVVEMVVHSSRREFDELITHFAAAQPDFFENDHAELLSAALEFDLLTRPYAYANTPCEVGVDLNKIRILENEDRCFTVISPFDFPRILRSIESGGTIPEELLAPNPITLKIDHRRGQSFRMPFKRTEDHHQFFHQWVTEIVNHVPTFKTERCRQTVP